MPIPASLVASVVSAVIETAVSSSTAVPIKQYDQYEIYVTKRILPPEAKVGYMLPPPGDGTIVISGQNLKASPTIQFRNQQNLIVMSMSLQKPSDVVYINDTYGAVHRVWLVTKAEADSLKKK